MTVTYPFPTDPAGIESAGEGTLFWVPAIANINAPTVAELSAGVNLSCVVYAFNRTVTQNKVERVKYCSKTVTERLGKAKHEIEAIEYDYDPQNIDDATGQYAHYATLAPNSFGFVVDRRGLAPSAAFAAGQVISAILPSQLGAQVPLPIVASNEGETHRVRQEIAVNGDPAIDVKVA